MSELEADSSAALERLISEQGLYIDEVDQQIEKWTRFQSDYEELQTRLKTLPDRLTYDCTVPFGKLAFIPGRIVHSNEILVLLGENYFVERSAKQSLEIVERRLKNIRENLNKHQKERTIFDEQKKYTKDFLDDRTKFFEVKEDDEQFFANRSQTRSRRDQLTEDEIRAERRRLQERAMKLIEPTSKKVRLAEKDDDSDDDDEDEEIPREKLEKITLTQPAPVAFTGKMVERPVEPPKRLSKFKASRS